MTGFKNFVMRGNLVELAVAVVIGTQFSSTVVHVLDLSSSRAYTAVTPAKGGFMRLTGRVEVKSERGVSRTPDRRLRQRPDSSEPA
jgi:hypothetical protein